MSTESEFKIQFSFDNSNITSTVPGQQKLRDAASERNPKAPVELLIEHSTNIIEDSSKTNDKHHIKLEDHENNDDKTQEKADEVTVPSKEDFVLTPVMTVTKEEAVFTKGDLKLQKVSVTEDISMRLSGDDHLPSGGSPARIPIHNMRKTQFNNNINSSTYVLKKLRRRNIDASMTTTIEQENGCVINNDEHEIRTAIYEVQQITTKTRTNEKEQKESRKPKTRIPTLKFRQAVEQLKQDRKSFEDKKEPESHVPPPKPRRSSIPRLKERRISAPIPKDTIPQKLETSDAPPQLNDEFDKLYNEIAEDQDSLDNLSICIKIEDPIKVDDTFEEIIHAYEENKIQPINVERVKQSKIPLLKRKSEHDIDVPKQLTSDVKQRTVIDLSKVKTSEIVTENHSKIQSVTLNKSPIRTSLISKKISEIKAVQDTSSGYSENFIKVNVATIEEANNDIEHNVIKKDVSKEVLHETPIANDNKSEFTTMERNISKDNEPNILSQPEQKQNNAVIKVSTHDPYNKSLNNVNTNKYIENTLSSEIYEETKNEEDIIVLKGKVNRIIKRIDSKEAETKHFKREFEDEALKEKSVLTKIAMFEHSSPVDATPKSTDLYVEQSSNTKPVESDFNHDLICHKPKIVEEVLKALPTRVIEVSDNIDNDGDIKKPETNDSNNHILTVKQDPSSNVEMSHIEIGDTQPYSQPENEHTPDIEIVDIQPKAPDQSTIEYITEFPMKSNNLESKDRNQTNVQEMDNKQVVHKITSKPVPNTQNPCLNFNGSRRDSQEQKIFDNDQNNITNRDELNKSAFVNNGPQIISDIPKEEVIFESIKVENLINNKENRTVQRKTPTDAKNYEQLRIQSYKNNEFDKKTKSNSVAELDLGDAIQGRVKNMIVRMKSLDRLDTIKKEVINVKEQPRRKSVSEKIALFEKKLTPIKLNKCDPPKIESKEVSKSALSEEECLKKIEELSMAKTKYGVLDQGKMKYLQLRDGGQMPVIGIGTALLDPKVTRYVIQAAIDLGYRTIDTAYIYGNEKEVGEAINEKIKDGTVSRSELFVISKLWSTFHRQDLVQQACRASLDAMGLDYFDLYLIHNPMSFKEGGDPIPKIANVLQFSEYDYLDAWFGVEKLVREGLVKRGGVSNFNSQQIDKVVDKGKIKPVINQVECHPYLSQHRLDDFCQARNVKLCCFGVLGSKGTPQDYKSALPPAIDDPLVRVMAAGLNVSPAALLISYQIALDRGVIVKACSAAHLWDNLQALIFNPSAADVSALHALNRNKRTYTFKGMGDTHRNYPFNIPF